MGQADAAADGISFDGEPDETALKPNPNIPGVPNWEIEDCRGEAEVLEFSGELGDSGSFWKILDEDWKNWMIGVV